MCLPRAVTGLDLHLTQRHPWREYPCRQGVGGTYRLTWRFGYGRESIPCVLAPSGQPARTNVNGAIQESERPLPATAAGQCSRNVSMGPLPLTSIVPRDRVAKP